MLFRLGLIKFRWLKFTMLSCIVCSCASLFPGVEEVAPNTYVIRAQGGTYTSAMAREESITEATAFCTGKRSSMALLPQNGTHNSLAPSAEIRFQCIYFPNDSQ